MLTEKEIHKIGRIDQIVRDFFNANPSYHEVRAMELMPEFISEGIFVKDSVRAGLPIRNILRKLDSENKLPLLKHCMVIRNAVNRSWYFVR